MMDNREPFFCRGGLVHTMRCESKRDKYVQKQCIHMYSSEFVFPIVLCGLDPFLHSDDLYDMYHVIFFKNSPFFYLGIFNFDQHMLVYDICAWLERPFQISGVYLSESVHRGLKPQPYP